MSRKWNIKCIPCGDALRLGESSDQYEEAAVAIVMATEALAAFGAALPGALVAGETFGLTGSLQAAWFTKHSGHDVVAVDEFGRVSDDCWRG